jgi:hypothetical protein
MPPHVISLAVRPGPGIFARNRAGPFVNSKTTEGAVMAKQRQSRVGGRDNRTGEFVPLRETERRPNTTTREHIPLPGYGDTGRNKDSKK